MYVRHCVEDDQLCAYSRAQKLPMKVQCAAKEKIPRTTHQQNGRKPLYVGVGRRDDRVDGAVIGELKIRRYSDRQDRGGQSSVAEESFTIAGPRKINSTRKETQGRGGRHAQLAGPYRGLCRDYGSCR